MLFALGCGGPATSDFTDPQEDLDVFALDGSLPLTCKTLTVVSGSIGRGQGVAGLAKQELNRTQDVWSKYVEFSPRTEAVCEFPIPSTLSVAGLRALQLRVNYRGPTKADMPWAFEVYDARAGAYVRVADNDFAKDWVWTSTSVALPAPLDRFVSNGILTMRYLTQSSADISQLDKWALAAVPGPGSPSDAGAASDAGPQLDGGSSPDAGRAHDGGTAVDAGPTCTPVCGGTTCGTSDGCGGTCEAGSGCATTPGTWWKPTNDQPLHLHWQLSDTFAYPTDVVAGQTIYDIDGDLNTSQTVAQLHAQGFKVICYMEVGSVENYRADYQAFVNAGVVGKAQVDWPGEFWLDISTQANIDKILPLMKTRMVDWCLNKGFDAIEPDTSDVDGAPVAQVVSYAKQIADMAHSLGLSIGLKNNAGSNATQLEPFYDWSLVEECWQYSECDTFRNNFLAANKPVFNVEYSSKPNCASANAWHMNSVRRDLDLVGPHGSGYVYEPCLPDSQSTW